MSEAPKSKNIFWHHGNITREDRERARGQRGATLWLTGLSGSGKSTISVRLEEKLFEMGHTTYVLDGDNVRHGLNRDLGFSPADRTENIRRIGEVAKLFTEAGVIVMTAFISPYREDRDQAREIHKDGNFIEVYVQASLDVCESRDPKGLYQKARAGIIPNFTGISAPYEEPENAEITVNTGESDLDACCDEIIAYLKDNGYLSAPAESA